MEYDRLVTELCEQISVDPREVLTTQHIMVGDQVVALIRPDDAENSRMPVLIELDQMFPDRDQELYQRMLATNAETRGSPGGSFCINRQSGRAAWRSDFDLREIATGEELASQLSHTLASAREAFQHVLASA